MPKIISFPERPASKEKSVSLLRRILNTSVGLLGGAAFVIFLPALFISIVVCSAANRLVYEFRGGYLANITFRSGASSNDDEGRYPAA